MKLTALVACLLLLACLGRAQNSSGADDSWAPNPSDLDLRMKPAAPAPASSQAARAGETQPIKPRSDISAYLAATGKSYEVWPVNYYKAAPDDDAKLAKDIGIAIDAYAYLKQKPVTYEDNQSFASWHFYMNQGEAKFNPNQAQTDKLNSALQGYFATGNVTQADLIYEGLVATDGNLTYALGSLAQLFCWNRDDYIKKVADMENVSGKDYYRVAGGFIGLHSTAISAAGQAGAYANMGGNPMVYAAGNIIASWKSWLTGHGMTPVDTLQDLGPDGHGDIVDKSGELQKGLSAVKKTIAQRGWRL